MGQWPQCLVQSNVLALKLKGLLQRHLRKLAQRPHPDLALLLHAVFPLALPGKFPPLNVFPLPSSAVVCVCVFVEESINYSDVTPKRICSRKGPVVEKLVAPVAGYTTRKAYALDVRISLVGCG